MNVRIHRGAAQVGGTCVEIEHDGKRVLLDLGMPLDAEEGEIPLPPVPGLGGSDPSLLGVVVSHLHGDHCGLVPYAAGVPLAMGPVGARILREAEFFTGRAPLPEVTWALRDRETFEIGPFRITPYQVEHSAFDAYALLVDAGGRRLFYTGDFRAHGNDRAPLERLLRDPPHDVHALMMEGTQIGAAREGEGRTEEQLREVLVRRFREHPGLVLVAWSSQNLDRLRTVYEATREARRALVLDLYTAALATAAAVPAGPRLGDPGLMVCPRQSERVKVKSAREFYRTNSIARWRIKREQLARRGHELVAMFRPSSVPELERSGALAGALPIWSMWRGYLGGVTEQRMLDALARTRLEIQCHHVSGHAYVSDLRRLVNAVRHERLVPIHTEAPARYAGLSPRVERHADGEWWMV